MITSLLRLPLGTLAVCAAAFSFGVASMSAAPLPYKVEFTSSGFIKNVTALDGTVLIERMGDFVLQAQTKSETGKVVHSHVAGPYGEEYIADIDEVNDARGMTYKVEAKHSRIQFTATYVCEPASIKVNLDLKPIDMNVEGGHVQMIFPVKFPDGLMTAEPQFRSDNVRFATTRGVLTLVFDNINWARYGVNGLRSFNGDRRSMSFYLSPKDKERPEPINLKFEIQLPAADPSR